MSNKFATVFVTGGLLIAVGVTKLGHKSQKNPEWELYTNPIHELHMIGHPNYKSVSWEFLRCAEEVRYAIGRERGFDDIKRKYGESLFMKVIKNYPVRSTKTGKIIPLNEAYREVARDIGADDTPFGDDPLGTSCGITAGLLKSVFTGKKYDIVDAILNASSKRHRGSSRTRKNRTSNRRSQNRGRPILGAVYNKDGRLVQYSTHFSEKDQLREERALVNKPWWERVADTFKHKKEEDNQYIKRPIYKKRNSDGSVTETYCYGTKRDALRERRKRVRKESNKQKTKGIRQFNTEMQRVRHGINQWVGNTQRQWKRSVKQINRANRKRQRQLQKDWRKFERNFIIPFQKRVGYRK